MVIAPRTQSSRRRRAQSRERYGAPHFFVFWAAVTLLKRILPILFAAFCALVLVLPFAKLGVPSGHDFDFHVSGWYDAAWQWRHGVVYPRIARWSDYGAGEPRFVFYPPLSWMWGALLTHVVAPRFVMAAYAVSVFTFGACGAWLLARRWFDPRAAWWAAACFVFNPYSVILVYWRSACAEMLGMALLPWVLLAWARMTGIALVSGQLFEAENLLPETRHPELNQNADSRHSVARRGALPSADETNPVPKISTASTAIYARLRSWEFSAGIVLLAVAFAVVWLANTPSALLISYLLGLLVLVQVAALRTTRALLPIVSLALGLAMTSFYLLPAVYEQRWLDLSQVLEPQLSPRFNVLFTRLGDPEFRAYNHFVSWIALALLSASIVGVAANFRRIARNARTALTVISALGFVLLLPISVALWEHLPKLRFVQFPWRYSFVLACAVALIIAASRPILRVALLCILWLPALVAMTHTSSEVYWTGADDATEFRDNIAAQKGYEGIWDYAPANTSINTIGEEDPEVAFRSGSGRAVHETVFEREFEVNARKPGLVRVEVLDYPAWHITLDGQPVANAHDDSGRVVVRVPQGLHRIAAKWHEPSHPRLWGAVLSAGTLAICGALIAFSSRVIRRRQLNSTNEVPQ